MKDELKKQAQKLFSKEVIKSQKSKNLIQSTGSSIEPKSSVHEKIKYQTDLDLNIKQESFSNEKWSITSIFSSSRLKKMSSKVTKSSQFESNLKKNTPKISLDNNITECSYEYIYNLLKDHKASFIPKEYFGTEKEDYYVRYLYNYVRNFRDSLQNLDHDEFQEIFKDCLTNPLLYNVSGYPLHILSNVFSLVVASDKEGYRNKLEFSAKILGELMQTKNPSNLDYSSLPNLTDVRSFQQAIEIAVTKARSSNVNDVEVKHILNNDDGSSGDYNLRIEGLELLISSTQKNHDLDELNTRTNTLVQRDIKVTGIQKADYNSHKSSSNIIYTGTLSEEEKEILRLNHCHKVKISIKELLVAPGVSGTSKEKKLLAVYEVINNYEKAENSIAGYFYTRQLDGLGYRFPAFINSDSFENT